MEIYLLISKTLTAIRDNKSIEFLPVSLVKHICYFAAFITLSDKKPVNCLHFFLRTYRNIAVDKFWNAMHTPKKCAALPSCRIWSGIIKQLWWWRGTFYLSQQWRFCKWFYVSLHQLFIVKLVYRDFCESKDRIYLLSFTNTLGFGIIM